MTHEVVGIGNALVDILVSLPDDRFLEQCALPRGTMNLVDERRVEDLLARTGGFPRSCVSGGSAANTVHGLAGLGVSCAYVGKIGGDETGALFRADLERAGITARLFTGTISTGRAVAFVSPDGERTFATYLGAAVHLTPEDLSPALFAGSHIVHIEGYLVQDHALLRRAVSLAHTVGALVSLDLASYNVVRENLSFLREIVSSRQVDILFANEEEAAAFTGESSARGALDEMARWCAVAVVKRGKEGSLVRRGDERVAVAARPAACRDTTGAGDLYAAGCLYGHRRRMPLERCADLGSLLAARVICRMGAKLTPEDWEAVRREMLS